MQIYGSTPRVIDRSQWQAGSTYDSANKVGSHPADSSLPSKQSADNPENAKSAALSALRNDRFGSMLEKVSDPRSSDAMMRMRQPAGGASADHGSVFAAYGENS